MANEGLVRDPGTQKFNSPSPSGDWHPGQGDDPNHHYFLRGAIFVLRHWFQAPRRLFTTEKQAARGEPMQKQKKSQQKIDFWKNFTF